MSMFKASSLLSIFVSSKGHSASDAQPLFESLEPRQFLSASPSVNPGGPMIPAPSIVVSNPIKTYSATLHLKAGQSFNGYVGGFSGAANVASDFRNLNASIDWGDGTSSPGVFAAGAKAGHISVGGRHTYATDGTFSITVTVSEGPILKPGQPNPYFYILLTQIHSHAVVSEPADTSGGVTIHEVAGQSFTTPVGKFNAIAPADGLSATINWGDGTTSSGKLDALPGISIDVIKFNVVGTHTYKAAGTYKVHVVVTRSIPMSVTPPFVIATIDSKADVAPEFTPV